MSSKIALSGMFSRLFSLFLPVFLLVSPAFAGGEHDTHGEHKAKFDAGGMITEHIADAHDWHVLGEGENSVSIPLPVILYSKEKGLDVFMSSKFHHGHADYDGYRLQHNHIVAVNEDGTVNEELTAGIWDLSITKNVATIFVVVLIMLWLFTSVAKAYTRKPNQAPSGVQSFVEPIIVFLRDDVAKASIGEGKYERFMPYLLTVFFFIWISNLLGLMPFPPGGANLTGNIAVTASLAIITFLITTFSGNAHYWRHIFAMPGVPAGVLVLLTPIEILGMFLRPFVLMIRLFANITAGHIIALSFFSLIFIFGEMNTGLGYGVSVISIAFAVFMMFLELLVAFLQAYVFTLLSAVYFGAAVEEHHDHDEHPHDGHHVVPEQNQQLLI